MLNKKNIIIISIFTLITFIVLIILTIFIGFSFLKQKPEQKIKKQITPKESEQELRVDIQRKEMNRLRGRNKVDNNSDTQLKNQRKAFEKLKDQQMVP